jgi:hypothetical protein
MTYLINEGALAINAADDRSINVFTLENESGAPLQAIITRDAGEPGEALAASVERQIKTLSRQVKNFKSIANEEMEITEAKWPAILREHSFKQGNQSAHQIQIVAQTPKQGFLIFSLSSTATISEAHRLAWIKTVTEFKPSI